MAADRRARHGHDIVGSLRGGSSGSAPPPVTYGASATAGTGGNETPARATVNPGGTATFPVTPNSGYVISSVTSSGGGLTGNTYTTGMVNGDCTVTASFSAAFTWIGYNVNGAVLKRIGGGERTSRINLCNNPGL